jgi:hypothetical protein
MRAPDITLSPCTIYSPNIPTQFRRRDFQYTGPLANPPMLEAVHPAWNRSFSAPDLIENRPLFSCGDSGIAAQSPPGTIVMLSSSYKAHNAPPPQTPGDCYPAQSLSHFDDVDTAHETALGVNIRQIESDSFDGQVPMIIVYGTNYKGISQEQISNIGTAKAEAQEVEKSLKGDEEGTACLPDVMAAVVHSRPPAEEVLLEFQGNKSHSTAPSSRSSSGDKRHKIPVRLPGTLVSSSLEDKVSEKKNEEIPQMVTSIHAETPIMKTRIQEQMYHCVGTVDSDVAYSRGALHDNARGIVASAA